MRILRLKIDKAVSIRLATLASELKAEVDFVLDIFALLRLKGSGLPSTARENALIAHLAKTLGSPLHARVIVRKQVSNLKAVTQLSYFTALSHLQNPITATEKLLTQFRKIGLQVRKAQCASCAFKSNCAFGQQYEGQITNITKVIDPDFSKKTHPDCPHLPEIGMTQQFNEAVRQLSALFDPKNAQQNQTIANQLNQDAKRQGKGNNDLEDGLDKAEDFEKSRNDEDAETDDSVQVGNGTDEDDFMPSNTGGHAFGSKWTGTFTAEYIVKVQEQMIDSVTQMGLDVFNLAQKLDTLLTSTPGIDFRPTDEISESKKSHQMESFSDLPKVDMSAHAMPEELHELREMQKSLPIEQQLAPTKKRQLLYVLIDVSGSMRCVFAPSSGIMSRASLSVVLTSALLKKVSTDGGYLFLRFFDGNVSPLTSMRTKDEYSVVLDKLKRANFGGGGTNITAAIEAALADISGAQNELSKAEILLITDAEDYLKMTKEDLKGITLNVLDVSGSAVSLYSSRHMSDSTFAPNVLKSIAKNYYKADERSLDPAKLVSLVK